MTKAARHRMPGNRVAMPHTGTDADTGYVPGT